MSESNFLLMIIILFLLLGCSAFFSGSETALMALSRLRLKHLEERKSRRAKLTEGVLTKPERLIGTILLGNNLVNVAMTAIATALAISTWGEKGIAYVTVVLTVIILIFAETTPKVYAKYYNEKVSLLTAPILHVMMLILSPVVFLITLFSNRLLLMVGINVKKVGKPIMTEDEILTSIKMGWIDGTITTDERKMASRVFMLNDKTAGEVMVPWDAVVYLDKDATLEETYRTIIETGHSRFPVVKKTDSEITGFIRAKDLFRFVDKNKYGSLDEITRPPYFVSPFTAIDDLLRTFKIKKIHQTIVKADDGRVLGIITLEDVIEELVGTIQDEHD
jgi:putative hemolysin